MAQSLVEQVNKIALESGGQPEASTLPRHPQVVAAQSLSQHPRHSPSLALTQPEGPISVAECRWHLSCSVNPPLELCKAKASFQSSMP